MMDKISREMPLYSYSISYFGDGMMNQYRYLLSSHTYSAVPPFSGHGPPNRTAPHAPPAPPRPPQWSRRPQPSVCRSLLIPAGELVKKVYGQLLPTAAFCMDTLAYGERSITAEGKISPAGMSSIRNTAADRENRKVAFCLFSLYFQCNSDSFCNNIRG